MVRASLFSVAVASTFIVAAVAQPVNSFRQEDNFERDFDLTDDLDLVSRDVDLAEREPLFPLFSAIGSGISAIAKAVAARKAKKAAEKQQKLAAGGAAPARTPKGGKKGGKKGKREFIDEDDDELFQRAEDVVEYFTRYLEDELEDFERRDWAESKSLEALD